MKPCIEIGGEGACAAVFAPGGLVLQSIFNSSSSITDIIYYSKGNIQ